MNQLVHVALQRAKAQWLPSSCETHHGTLRAAMVAGKKKRPALARGSTRRRGAHCREQQGDGDAAQLHRPADPHGPGPTARVPHASFRRSQGGPCARVSAPAPGRYT
eukprot:14149911-Ditylum_brightwellii.AAC.1